MNGGGGWGIFNAILGWQNSATYGSVLSYNLYWLVIILAFLAMRFNERNGHWPLRKPKKVTDVNGFEHDSNSDTTGVGAEEKSGKPAEEGQPSTAIREVEV